MLLPVKVQHCVGIRRWFQQMEVAACFTPEQGFLCPVPWAISLAGKQRSNAVSRCAAQ